MNGTLYNTLLREIQHLFDLQSEMDSMAKKRGELYNIFEILHLTSRETRLHSAMIADLLNPCGNHALGIRPLKLFLDCVRFPKTFSEAEYENASVETEYNAGAVNEDCTKGGKIDILVTVAGHKIVIENKIYADDQPSQLLRYHNFCSAVQHSVYYLTLDGRSPSEYSAKGMCEDEDFMCISYAVEILEWLRKCAAVAFSKPLVRETLQQYINTILKLTHQNMAQKTKTDLFEVMAEYPEAVAAIADSMWHFRRYMAEQYIVLPFKKWCGDNGFLWYEDAGFLNQAKYSGFGIYRATWKKMIAAEFNSSDFRGLYYGVWKWNSTDGAKTGLVAGNGNDNWPYGWAYLDEYPDWSVTVARELKEGKVFECILAKFQILIDKIDSEPQKYPMES